MSQLHGTLRQFLDRWVHPDAADDPLIAARYRSFVAGQLVPGAFGLGVFPLWMSIVRELGMIEAAAFAVLAAPLLIAGFLAKTGRIDIAEIMSAFLLTGLAVVLAMRTGWSSAPVLTLLLLVPIDGSLSGSKRTLLASAATAAAGLAIAATLAGSTGDGEDIKPAAFAVASLFALVTVGRVYVAQRTSDTVAGRRQALLSNAINSSHQGKPVFGYSGQQNEMIVIAHHLGTAPNDPQAKEA